MPPPASWDAAALGWYSQKRTFKRKYLCVRPKYAAAKLDGIKRSIHRLTMQQLEEERERERVEREEAASKEEDEGKRKVMEEEAEKATRLAELKAKAEGLRQEKSNLFGLLKQALVEDAKRKQREERLEKLRKEEQDKKDKEQRALAEAAQALTGAAQFHVYQREGLQPPAPGQGLGALPRHPGGAPMVAAYGAAQQPPGYPNLAPRNFYQPPERPGPGGQPPAPAGAFPPAPPGAHHSMYPPGAPQAGMRRTMLPGGMQQGMPPSFRDARGPPDHRFPPMSMHPPPGAPGMLAAAPGRGEPRPPPPQGVPAPGGPPPPPDARDAGRGRSPGFHAEGGRGMFYPPQGGAGRGWDPQQPPRRW